MRATLIIRYECPAGYAIEPLVHIISRDARFADSQLGSNLAEFGYAGGMRRVPFNQGWIAAASMFAVAQGFDASGSPGSDLFGRVAELRLEGASRSGSAPALQRFCS